MERKLLRPEYFRAVRTIMLMGGSIYLFVFGVTMAFGSFTWHADWLGTHGEPFLVIALSAWAALEAIWAIRRL